MSDKVNALTAVYRAAVQILESGTCDLCYEDRCTGSSFDGMGCPCFNDQDESSCHERTSDREDRLRRAVQKAQPFVDRLPDAARNAYQWSQLDQP